MVDESHSRPLSSATLSPLVPPPSVSPPPSPSPQNEVPLSRKRSSLFRELSDTDDDDKEATELLASIKAQESTTSDALDKTPRKSTADSETPATSRKSGKAELKSASAKKTSALPGSSTPVSKGKGKNSSKKLKFGDQFTEAIVAEEQTHQKELDVHLRRAELDKLKLKGKIDVKCERLRLKAEMQKLAMVQEHQECMAKISQRQGVGERLCQALRTRAYPIVAGAPGSRKRRTKLLQLPPATRWSG